MNFELTYAERMILKSAIEVCNKVCRRAYDPAGDESLADVQAQFGIAECELRDAILQIDVHNHVGSDLQF